MTQAVALFKGIGWKHVQLDKVTKMQKTWDFENKTYSVEVFFGILKTQTPVFIMNVYNQGAGTKQVIDDNCDVWENVFTSITKEDGNELFKYLKKHGFNKVA